MRSKKRRLRAKSKPERPSIASSERPETQVSLIDVCRRRGYIAISDVKIPKDQAMLLEEHKSQCWMPPHTGLSTPHANIPIALLMEFNREVDEKARAGRQKQYPTLIKQDTAASPSETTKIGDKDNRHDLRAESDEVYSWDASSNASNPRDLDEPPSDSSQESECPPMSLDSPSKSALQTRSTLQPAPAHSQEGILPCHDLSSSPFSEAFTQDLDPAGSSNGLRRKDCLKTMGANGGLDQSKEESHGETRAIEVDVVDFWKQSEKTGTETSHSPQSRECPAQIVKNCDKASALESRLQGNVQICDTPASRVLPSETMNQKQMPDPGPEIQQCSSQKSIDKGMHEPMSQLDSDVEPSSNVRDAIETPEKDSGASSAIGDDEILKTPHSSMTTCSSINNSHELTEPTMPDSSSSAVLRYRRSGSISIDQSQEADDGAILIPWKRKSLSSWNHVNFEDHDFVLDSTHAATSTDRPDRAKPGTLHDASNKKASFDCNKVADVDTSTSTGLKQTGTNKPRQERRNGVETNYPSKTSQFPDRSEDSIVPNLSTHLSPRERKLSDDKGRESVVPSIEDETHPRETVARSTIPIGNNTVIDAQRNLYRMFKTAYPCYPGDIKPFITLCQKIFNANDSALPQFLWDDYVIRQRTEYPQYVSRCIEEGEDIEPYELFFSREVDSVLYDKRVVNQQSLETACACTKKTDSSSHEQRKVSLDEHIASLGPSISPPKSTHSIPLPSSKRSRNMIADVEDQVDDCVPHKNKKRVDSSCIMEATTSGATGRSSEAPSSKRRSLPWERPRHSQESESCAQSQESTSQRSPPSRPSRSASILAALALSSTSRIPETKSGTRKEQDSPALTSSITTKEALQSQKQTTIPLDLQHQSPLMRKKNYNAFMIRAWRILANDLLYKDGKKASEQELKDLQEISKIIEPTMGRAMIRQEIDRIMREQNLPNIQAMHRSHTHTALQRVLKRLQDEECQGSKYTSPHEHQRWIDEAGVPRNSWWCDADTPFKKITREFAKITPGAANGFFSKTASRAPLDMADKGL